MVAITIAVLPVVLSTGVIENLYNLCIFRTHRGILIELHQLRILFGNGELPDYVLRTCVEGGKVGMNRLLVFLWSLNELIIFL